MKWFHFVKTELSLGVRKSLLELSLVTMGLFVGFFTLLLCDGMIKGITASQRSASRYRSISVVFSKEDAQAAIQSVLEDEPFGSVSNGFVICLAKEPKAYTVIGWKGGGFNRWHALSAGSSFFTPEQTEAEERIAFLSIDEPDEANQMKEVELRGKSYRVIGEESLILPAFFSGLPEEELTFYNTQDQFSVPLVIIPYRCFFEDGFTVSVLRLDMTEPLAGRREKLEAEISARFPGAQVYLAGEIEENPIVQRRFALYRLVFSGMAAMAILNLIALLQQMVSGRRERYRIYAFCGANTIHALCLVLSECVAWGTFAFLLANVVLRVLTPLLTGWQLPLLLSFPRALLFLVGVVLFAFLLTLRTTLEVSRQSVLPKGGIS